MANFVVMAVVVVATVPLTIWGVRFAKRHRGMAAGAATLLLLFGPGMRIDPPPPPRSEWVQRKEREVDDAEPE